LLVEGTGAWQNIYLATTVPERGKVMGGRLVEVRCGFGLIDSLDDVTLLALHSIHQCGWHRDDVMCWVIHRLIRSLQQCIGIVCCGSVMPAQG
jgi:hypothetical protein